MSAILAVLEPLGDPVKAGEMAAYHKTDRRVLGVSNPQIDVAVRDWREGRDITAVLAEARALWSSGVFEARIAAAKLLTKARIREHEAEVWETIVGWVPEFDGWAIADHAAKAGERRLMADLARMDVLEGWTRSDHMWTKRAALVMSLPLAKLRHPKPHEVEARMRVLGWAADYVHDPDWFIQKAVAWWLRTLSAHDPALVRAFIEANGPQMKAFARKDATRRLD